MELSQRRQLAIGLIVVGVAALLVSPVGMLSSIHERCDDCHDIMTGVSFYTSPWFGRFAWLLVAGVIATATGNILLHKSRLQPAQRRGAWPAGWYQDPSGVPFAQRYWDGRAWTNHVTRPTI